MKSFKGKVAAITGAGSGIGRALALELAQAGCHLALSGRSQAGLDETAAMVRRRKRLKVTAKLVDVADRQAVYAWADHVVAEHGRCNLIFNNAGVAHGTTIESVSYDDFEWLMNINFWGVVYGTKAFLPYLRASGEGHVVNISSIAGLIALPSQGTYTAAKFAVRGFTEALREELELARAMVSATCVHPGGIKTNIAQSARIDRSATAFGVKDEEAGRALFETLISTTTAASAAQTILRGVQRNAPRVLIGPDAYAADVMQRMLPAAYPTLVALVTRLITRHVP